MPVLVADQHLVKVDAALPAADRGALVAAGCALFEAKQQQFTSGLSAITDPAKQAAAELLRPFFIPIYQLPAGAMRDLAALAVFDAEQRCPALEQLRLLGVAEETVALLIPTEVTATTILAGYQKLNDGIVEITVPAFLPVKKG